MRTTTLRIRPESLKALKELAALTGKSVQDVIAQAIEDQQRKFYLEGLNADDADLERNRKALGHSGSSFR